MTPEKKRAPRQKRRSGATPSVDDSTPLCRPAPDQAKPGRTTRSSSVSSQAAFQAALALTQNLHELHAWQSRLLNEMTRRLHELDQSG